MKVIDLLNKIANGEEVPKKIKFQNKIYHFNREYMDYESDIQEYRNADVKENYYIFSEWCPMLLNDEVEIIEEDKEIRELECLEIAPVSAMYCLSDKNMPEEEKWKKVSELIYEYRIDMENLKYYINEIVRAVNELKEGK